MLDKLNKIFILNFISTARDPSRLNIVCACYGILNMWNSAQTAVASQPKDTEIAVDNMISKTRLRRLHCHGKVGNMQLCRTVWDQADLAWWASDIGIFGRHRSGAQVLFPGNQPCIYE